MTIKLLILLVWFDIAILASFPVHLRKYNESILKKFGLWESREKHPAALSGGQKQRLILALSEKKDKDIMIFDEPTSGLNGKNMRITAEYFEEQAKKGKTIIVITHNYEFIFTLFTTKCIIKCIYN